MNCKPHLRFEPTWIFIFGRFLFILFIFTKIDLQIGKMEKGHTVGTTVLSKDLSRMNSAVKGAMGRFAEDSGAR